MVYLANMYFHNPYYNKTLHKTSATHKEKSEATNFYIRATTLKTVHYAEIRIYLMSLEPFFLRSWARNFLDDDNDVFDNLDFASMTWI